MLLSHGEVSSDCTAFLCLLGLRSASSGSSSLRKVFAMRRASSAGSEGPFLKLAESQRFGKLCRRRTANDVTALVGPCVPLGLLVLCILPELASHGSGSDLRPRRCPVPRDARERRFSFQVSALC